MSDTPRDKCGVVAVSSTQGNVSTDIYLGLIAIQHRGQESCGIASIKNGEILKERHMGLVTETINDRMLMKLDGKMGIGHVRYSTTGASIHKHSQPFFSPDKSFAMAYNGNLTNYHTAKTELKKLGFKFETSSDTEIIVHYLTHFLKSEKDKFEVVRKLMQKIEGSYSIVVLFKNSEILAFRDPLGFKPLCVGRDGIRTVVASESCVLDTLCVPIVREVQPGEAVHILKNDLHWKMLAHEERHAHCMFEYVYFARPDSQLENINVGMARENLGKTLAKLYPLDVDLIIPIPDSGRSAAYGYSVASKIPMSEALVKNRYIYRTFIMPADATRKSSIHLKLNPVKAIIKGKRVALVDDSIVRGSTMQKIVKLVREAGATEVHLIISCPPIIAPCFMGIDFPTYKELIASDKSVEQIRKMLNVDSLNYMTIEGLVRAIGLPKNDLCMACLTNVYPVNVSEPFGEDK